MIKVQADAVRHVEMSSQLSSGVLELRLGPSVPLRQDRGFPVALQILAGRSIFVAMYVQAYM